MTGRVHEAGGRRHIELSVPIWRILILLVCAGIVFNNLLRWYPFPAGRSANDMTTLDTSMLGIIVNVFLYSAILAVVVLIRSSRLRHYRSWPLLLYCLYLALQVPFRANPPIEALRSWAMILMLLSADWLAAVVISSPRRAVPLLRSIWWTMVATLVIGLVIGLALEDSVNWGNDLSPSFAQTARAEFFFFHVLPHYGFALSLAVMVLTRRRPGVRFLAALVTAALIPALALRTMTRTMIFSLMLVALVFMFRYARRSLLLVSAVGVLSLLFWPAAMSGVADRLRVSAFLSSDPGVDATNGRLFLVMTNLQSFRDSPVFGQGAVEARRRVEVSASRAKSEHGYSLHLASSGVFSLLLFAYVVQGLAAGIRIVLRREQGSVGPFGVAIAAVAITSFFTGFFWTFSSATAFYEWVGIFFVSAARVTSHMAWPPRRISIGASCMSLYDRAHRTVFGHN